MNDSKDDKVKFFNVKLIIGVNKSTDKNNFELDV